MANNYQGTEKDWHKHPEHTCSPRCHYWQNGTKKHRIGNEGVLLLSHIDVGDNEPVMARIQDFDKVACATNPDDALNRLADKLESMARNIRLYVGKYTTSDLETK